MQLDDLFLNEAPIEDLTLVGNWSKSSSFRDPQDRKIISNPKAQQHLIHKWKSTPVPFNMYFVNNAEANKYTEIGEVTQEWLQQRMPKTAAEIVIRDDAVNVIFTNNKGSARVPMTAWIIAHRFGHSVSRYQPPAASLRLYRQVPEWEEARNQLIWTVKTILADAYGIGGNLPRDAEDIFKSQYKQATKLFRAFYYEIGTMRSARNRNLRDEFEFIHELLAQYITTGHVKFKPLPDTFYIAGHYGHHNAFPLTREGIKDREYYQNLLDVLAQDLDRSFHYMMESCVGRIFVM